MLPYTHTIAYPKCIGSGIQNTGKPNKLLSVMTVSRHGFHNGVMTYMLNLVKVLSQNFCGVGSICEVKPDDGFLPYNMSELFNKTGHGLVEIMIVLHLLCARVEQEALKHGWALSQKYF